MDPSLYQNNSARYSQKMEVKTGKFGQKETKIQETQVRLSLQSPEMLDMEIFFFFCGKFYSSCQTSAFGNPLVQDKRVLVLDGRMSGSFLL